MKMNDFMKTYAIVLTALLSTTLLHAQSKKVLFIGNSYTGSNNLPQLTRDLALSAGDTLIYDAHTPGGATLSAHAGNPGAISKIFSDQWDHVVIQAQSQEPSFGDAQVQQQVFPYATALCDTIRVNDSCTRPVFYMTWGRKNGDALNCAVAPWLCTYEGMDSVLNQNYRIMGANNAAFVSPVGAVWHYIRTNYPSIELYAPDGSHPSPAGSYAAACTFYSILFRRDPSLISFDYSLDTADAKAIRTAAKAIAYDSLSTWNVGAFDPVAAFNHSVQNGQVTFTNTSTNADTWLWNFDDGSTSGDENPTHVYTSTGTFQVRLIASGCGLTDTSEIAVSINSIGIEESITNDVIIYPNPATSKIHIEGIDSFEIQHLELFNSIGQRVRSIGGSATNIELSGVVPGIYFLSVELKNKQRFTKKIIKQQH